MALPSGKVVIVTGGSKGMGRHFVQILADAGARIGFLARKSPELAAVQAQHDDAALAIPCDVSSSAQVNAAVDSVVEKFGRLDIVVGLSPAFSSRFE